MTECRFVLVASGLTLYFLDMWLSRGLGVKFKVLLTWSGGSELFDCGLSIPSRARTVVFLASKLPILLSNNVVPGTSIHAWTSSGFSIRILTISEGFGLPKGSCLQQFWSKDALKIKKQVWILKTCKSRVQRTIYKHFCLKDSNC